MTSDGIYLSHFFRAWNPFHVLGWVWFVVFGGIAAYYYTPSKDATCTRRFIECTARVLPAAVAGLVGWIAFGYLWVLDWRESRWDHIVVAAIAFLGITGHLPRALMTNRFFGWWFQPSPSGPSQHAIDLRVHPPA